MKRITKKERLRVRRYISEIAPFLGLGCWDIILLHETSPEGTDATAECMNDTRRVFIKLHDDWMTFTKKRKTYTIIHELLHASIFPVIQAAHADELNAGQREAFREAEEVWADVTGNALRLVLPQYPGHQKHLSDHVHGKEF